MKTKLISLWLAALLALSLAGCNMATPATVGTIGDVEITAGLYLLTQYNDYTITANAAELATGETASDVDAVLKATATGTIGDEEFTGTGAEYLARLVARDLDHYAAVETAFTALGGELTEGELAAIQESTDSMWESNGELYTANGIGKESLQLYATNVYKNHALLDLYYGPDGAEPVADAELESFITDECIYMEGVQFPLVDYTTYAMADEEQTEQIHTLAEDCVRTLAADVAEDADTEAVMTAMQDAAVKYVPQAFEAMGGSLDESIATYYALRDLVLPDDLENYAQEDGSNTLKDAFDTAGMDEWTVVDLTTTLLAARRTDPLATHSVEDLCAEYDILDAMRGDDLEARLYAEGAALPHALDQGAMNTYKPGKITRTV